MSYKTFIIAAAVLASASIANAHPVSNGSIPFGWGVTPSDLNQGVERDVHGAPHGSISNPSPHSYTDNRNVGSSALAQERSSQTPATQNAYTGGGSEGYERLLKTY